MAPDGVLPHDVRTTISFQEATGLLKGMAAPDNQNSVASLTMVVKDPKPRNVLHTWGRLRSLGHSDPPGGIQGVNGELFAVAQTLVGLRDTFEEVRLITLDGATYWNIIFASAQVEYAFGDYMGGLGFEYPQDLRSSNP